MTAAQLKQLEKDLWDAADDLRANSKLTASEYTMPVLGLIFLRQASNRYDQIKAEIESTLVKHPTRGFAKIDRDDFWRRGAISIPPKAHFNHLVSLPESEDIGKAIDTAMKLIEIEHEYLKGVLPKTYTSFEKPLLLSLIRIFNGKALQAATGDVFGKIYEFFLNEFAMKGAQEGGEFFTPLSLVSLIVNFIEPLSGIVFDPACGSFGMAIQTGHFIENKHQDPNKKVTFYGQEKTSTNTQIAKMNMAVHGYDANKILEGNTFYEDKHELIGKCQYVMANPPFNVDRVDKDREVVKKDKRLPFGLPKNDNANYLWIQYFYAYLNDTGRAGFVMASSASDAGHSEKLIRQKLVETRAVDIMVAISNNFFYTRSLPCTLWFYDKAKAKDKKRNDKTLMLDARKVFRKVSTTVNDFSQEQLENLTCITKLYRGESEYMVELVASRNLQIFYLLKELQLKQVEALLIQLNLSIGIIETVEHKTARQFLNANTEIAKQAKQYNIFSDESIRLWEALHKKPSIKASVAATENVLINITQCKTTLTVLQKLIDPLPTLLRDVVKQCKADKINWDEAANTKHKIEQLQSHIVLHNETITQTEYQLQQHLWLLQRFTNGTYNDVQGLCKVVSIDEIAAKDYSLSPGRYVGVEDNTDNNEDWQQKLQSIHNELGSLNKQANQLANTIFENYKLIEG
jgi:type I restriction enzyme M protein